MATVTNYIINPSFEVDTTGWDTDGGVTISRITSGATVGTGALEISLNGSGWQGVVSSPVTRYATVPGDVWYASVNVASADVTNIGLYSEEYNSSSSFLRQTTLAEVPLAGRIGGSFIAGANAAYIRIMLRANNDAGTVVADAFFLSHDNVSYFDGDTADGGGFRYDWTGTPGLSASTRTVTTGAARIRRQFQLRPY